MTEVEEFTWYGKHQSELSREELLDVITHLHEEAKRVERPCPTCQLLCQHR